MGSSFGRNRIIPDNSYNQLIKRLNNYWDDLNYTHIEWLSPWIPNKRTRDFWYDFIGCAKHLNASHTLTRKNYIYKIIIDRHIYENEPAKICIIDFVADKLLCVNE